MEFLAYLEFPLSDPSLSPTQIWWMGITTLDITPEIKHVEITPVDAPPLPDVEVCSIFEDDAISIITINLPSTPTREV